MAHLSKTSFWNHKPSFVRGKICTTVYLFFYYLFWFNINFWYNFCNMKRPDLKVYKIILFIWCMSPFIGQRWLANGKQISAPGLKIYYSVDSGHCHFTKSLLVVTWVKNSIVWRQTSFLHTYIHVYIQVQFGDPFHLAPEATPPLIRLPYIDIFSLIPHNRGQRCNFKIQHPIVIIVTLNSSSV